MEFSRLRENVKKNSYKNIAAPIKSPFLKSRSGFQAQYFSQMELQTSGAHLSVCKAFQGSDVEKRLKNPLKRSNINFSMLQNSKKAKI